MQLQQYFTCQDKNVTSGIQEIENNRKKGLLNGVNYDGTDWDGNDTWSQFKTRITLYFKFKI